ncbi:hypothetical protein F5Y05DRAFT_13294 [Hypoxylon sp. FL0543]|nr:hypothetical protein F5Y05DRAFT_13294 [Hypoxylon sp. FL0543]
MKVLRGAVTVSALLIAAAQAFPRQLDTVTGATTAKPVETTPADAPEDTSTLPDSTSPPETVTPAATTTQPSSASDSPTSTFTGYCDYSYCNELGSNVCFYWAGYTSWDVSRGPIPGEIPTVLGPCSTET